MAPTTSTRPGTPVESSTRGPAERSAPTRAWPSDETLSTADALEILSSAPLAVVGRLADASNASFYCRLDAATSATGAGAPDPQGPGIVHAVYKPVAGERPLADFPDGTLAFREVAAWLVSEAAGLHVVPPTVLREGPYGPGMLQLWMTTDDEADDPLTLILTRDPQLRPVALLDVLINNADRKGGHLLPIEEGRVLGCDHGICFAAEPKLRTVLWGWAGEALTSAERSAVQAVRTALDGRLGAGLARMLSPDEVDATRRRADALLTDGRFPPPDRDRRVIPWPPF